MGDTSAKNGLNFGQQWVKMSRYNFVAGREWVKLWLKMG